MSVPSIGARTNVTTAIATASQKTGIDFNYLLGQAQVESGMRTDARARTSSMAPGMCHTRRHGRACEIEQT